MNVYHIKVQDDYWQDILAGRKTVEGRINRDHHAQVRPGMPFEIQNTLTGDIIEGTVTFVNYYDTFRDALINEGLRNMLPGVESLEEGIRTYREIPGYAQGEKDNGVVTIGLR